MAESACDGCQPDWQDQKSRFGAASPVGEEITRDEDIEIVDHDEAIAEEMPPPGEPRPWDGMVFERASTSGAESSSDRGSFMSPVP
jgi:hypothetical protein